MAVLACLLLPMATQQIIIDNTTFRVGGVGASISGDYERDATGVPWLKNVTWDLEIRFLKEFGSLDSQINDLEQLFRSPNLNKIGIYEDGSPTAHYVDNSMVIGGIRPSRPPSYMKFTNGEMVTYRSVTASVEMTYPLYTSPFQILELNETIPQVAMGRNLAILQPNFGQAVLQQVRQYQHSRLTQSGTIVYAAAYGRIPPPLFNVGLVSPPQITPRQPRKIGRGVYAGEVAFAIDYSYEFVWPRTLAALPTRWIS